MNRYSVIMTGDINQILIDHLVRRDRQEDLCFALYKTSSGNNRLTAIITHVILPIEGERDVHGNVGFYSNYLERVLKLATQRNEGVAFLHSHPFPGWQGMSEDDEIAENRLSASALAVTDLPLLGMTVGSDFTWSARFWIKDSSQKRVYVRNWCENVRVLDKELKIDFNEDLLPINIDTETQLRTLSAWGNENQAIVSRLRVGIVGLGSVGSIVAEILARTGFSNFVLIDFDTVERKNLDRLTNVFKSDIGKAKVDAVNDGIYRSGTSPNISVTCVEYSICEKDGFGAALDCDVLFSCVDRPWPRQVLNLISYAHMIPVIDGGIMVRTNRKNSSIVGADWKAHTVGYRRACMECLGQYKTENASLEKAGLLDDPNYIKGLEQSKFIDAHENVFVFSSHLASMEVQQMLSLIISPSGVADIGQQTYHFVTGTMDHERTICHDNCFFQSIIGVGDSSGIESYAIHKVAEEARESRLKLTN